jgi:hypothetical protein
MHELGCASAALHRWRAAVNAKVIGTASKLHPNTERRESEQENMPAMGGRSWRTSTLLKINVTGK